MALSSRPRIAHICTADMSIKYLLKNQLRILEKLGYDVFALSGSGEFYNELNEEKFHYRVLPIYRRINPILDLYSLLAMSLCFYRLKPRLVHAHTNKAGILGCWAAALAGVPNIVSTVHGFYFHEHMNPLMKKLFVVVYRLTFKLTNIIFMQSAEDVETTIRLNIAPRNKLMHLGNGIDLERFNPNNTKYREEARLFRLSFNIPLDCILIGIIARLNNEKGLKELLAAVRNILRKSKTNIHLVIIGEGPLKNELRHLAASFGISSNVHFTGYQENIPGWLLAMDIFTLPSYREGLPRSICEAFAMGTPVVASNIRGCRELVKDRKTGLLVSSRSASELANAINELIKDEQLRFEISRNARRFAHQFLDEKRVVEIISTAYEELGVACPQQKYVKSNGRSIGKSDTNYDLEKTSAS